MNRPTTRWPTIKEWLLLIFIAYVVIGTLVGFVYGIFFADPVCCADTGPYSDGLR
jgi:hypothetical protein